VTEARDFTPEGDSPNFPGLQTGSVSTFQLAADGSLSNSQIDLPAGQSGSVGQRTACWIVMSPDGEFFWVSNALDTSISSYRITDDITDDGAFLYQLYGLSGVVGVCAVDGGNLTLVQEVSGNLPEVDTQGIVSF